MPGENIEVGSVTNFLKLGLAGVIAGIFLVLWHKYFPLAVASPIAAVASPVTSGAGDGVSGGVPFDPGGIRFLGPPTLNPSLAGAPLSDTLPSIG